MSRMGLGVLLFLLSISSFAAGKSTVRGYYCRSGCFGVDTDSNRVFFYGIIDAYGVKSADALKKLQANCVQETSGFDIDSSFLSNRGNYFDAAGTNYGMQLGALKKTFEKNEATEALNTFIFTDHSRLEMKFATVKTDCVKAKFDESDL